MSNSNDNKQSLPTGTEVKALGVTFKVKGTGCSCHGCAGRGRFDLCEALPSCNFIVFERIGGAELPELDTDENEIVAQQAQEQYMLVRTRESHPEIASVMYLETMSMMSTDIAIVRQAHRLFTECHPLDTYQIMKCVPIGAADIE